MQNAIGETSSSGAWFPDGVSGILGALPFAMWFFLGIEDVAVAGDECIDATVSIPRGVGLAMVTLLLLAFSTLFTMSSVAPLPQLAKSTR